MREVYHPFCEDIWRFIENPEKSGKNPETGKFSETENHHIIHEKYTNHSVMKSEKLMKIRKKTGNRIYFRKRKSSYHKWEVNHTFCKEICWKLLKYEIWTFKKKKKRDFYTQELRSRSKNWNSIFRCSESWTSNLPLSLMHLQPLCAL